MKSEESRRRAIEREAAEALLDVGVTLPLLSVRLPLTRRRVTVRVTMRRPTLGRMIEIARIYLSTGVRAEELERMTKEEEMRFLADHGKAVSRMIALTLGSWWKTGLLAWAVRHMVRHEYQLAAMRRFVSLLGTDPFLNIISSAERMNPMRRRLSRERKGS